LAISVSSYFVYSANTLNSLFSDADPEFGAKQAHELHYHLQYVLQDFAVDIVNGKGYVEVRPAGCDKGRAAKALFEEVGCPLVSMFRFVLKFDV